MSSYLNLLPEYKDKNGVWHPIYANGKSDMYFQCNMRDCLRDLNRRIDEKTLTDEELKFFKGTYTAKEPIWDDISVKKDENGNVVYKDVEKTFDYTSYAKVVTLDELFEEAEKEKQFYARTITELIGDVENAVKSVELAKIMLIKGETREIPHALKEELFQAKNELIDYATIDDYNSLDNYICLNHLAQILIGFSRAAGQHTDDLRFLYYVM